MNPNGNEECDFAHSYKQGTDGEYIVIDCGVMMSLSIRLELF